MMPYRQREPSTIASQMLPAKGSSAGRLAVKIDGKVFSADTIRDLFTNVLKFIVDHKYVLRIPLPWGSSSQRYIITVIANLKSATSSGTFVAPLLLGGTFHGCHICHQCVRHLGRNRQSRVGA